MIIHSALVKLTYEELEKIFNEHLKKEIEDWEEEKKEYLEDPCNTGGKTIAPYMPNPFFQIWMHIPLRVVPEKIQETLRNEIQDAGWNITLFEWMKDEKTNEDILHINIRK